MLLPIVLGFSPHPPVSVYGTGDSELDSSFSRQCGMGGFDTLISLPVRSLDREAYLTTPLPTSLSPAFPAAGSAYPPASLLLL